MKKSPWKARPNTNPYPKPAKSRPYVHMQGSSKWSLSSRSSSRVAVNWVALVFALERHRIQISVRISAILRFSSFLPVKTNAGTVSQIRTLAFPFGSRDSLVGIATRLRLDGRVEVRFPAGERDYVLKWGKFRKSFLLLFYVISDSEVLWQFELSFSKLGRLCKVSE